MYMVHTYVRTYGYNVLYNPGTRIVCIYRIVHRMHCTYCTHCTYFTYCTHCTYCTYFMYCTYCTYCTHCTHCTYCTYCTYCTHCIHCTHCTYCTHYFVCSVHMLCLQYWDLVYFTVPSPLCPLGSPGDVGGHRRTCTSKTGDFGHNSTPSTTSRDVWGQPRTLRLVGVVVMGVSICAMFWK